MKQITFTAIEDIPLIKEGDNLGEIIYEQIMDQNVDLKNSDILVE